MLYGYTLLSCRYDADELPRCSSEEARGDPSQLYDVVSQIALLMTEMVANDGVDKLSTLPCLSQGTGTLCTALQSLVIVIY